MRKSLAAGQKKNHKRGNFLLDVVVPAAVATCAAVQPKDKREADVGHYSPSSAISPQGLEMFAAGRS